MLATPILSQLTERESSPKSTQAKDPIVAIVSGGLDSTTLLYWLVRSRKEKVHVLSFQYGQRHDSEVFFAQWHARYLEREGVLSWDLINLRGSFSHAGNISSLMKGSAHKLPTGVTSRTPTTYVPFRNLIMLSAAASFAESVKSHIVAYGAQVSDTYGYWDCTPEFLTALNNVFILNKLHSTILIAPFIHKSKSEILEIGFELEVDYSHTWSCYRGKNSSHLAPCGVCPTCRERLAAFGRLGKEDPLVYEFDV